MLNHRILLIVFSFATGLFAFAAGASSMCSANCLLVVSGTYTDFEIHSSGINEGTGYVLLNDLGEVRARDAASIRAKCSVLAAAVPRGPYYTVWSDKVELKVAGAYSVDSKSKVVTSLDEKVGCHL